MQRWMETQVEGVDMDEDSSRRFYVVWNTGRGIPKVKHEDFCGAELEATRLAERHPGEKFYILRAVAVAEAKIKPTTATELQ